MTQFFLLIAVIAPIHADDQIVGKITALDGPPEIALQNGAATRKARVGDPILEHDRILTLENQTVVLKLDDQSEISLGSATSLEVEKFISGSRNTTILNQLYGLVRTIVNRHYRANETFVLKTPSAAMGVRGTQFLTEVDKKTRATNLYTLEGKVAMAASLEALQNPNAVVLVAKGMSSSIHDGMGKPSAAQPSDATNVEQKLRATQKGAGRATSDSRRLRPRPSLGNASAMSAGSQSGGASDARAAKGNGMAEQGPGPVLGPEQGAGPGMGPGSGPGGMGGGPGGAGPGMGSGGGIGGGPGLGAGTGSNPASAPPRPAPPPRTGPH